MENIFKGIDLGMNAAILHMATKLFPCGFDVVPDGEAPNTLERVQADILQGRLHPLKSVGRLAVWHHVKPAREELCGHMQDCGIHA